MQTLANHAKRGAKAAALFACAGCMLQLAGTYVDAPGLNGGVVFALLQLAVTLGMAFGIYRGGFGWAGLVTLAAFLPVLAAVGPIILFIHGAVDGVTVGLWVAYAAAGLSVTPLLGRATWQLWKADRMARAS